MSRRIHSTEAPTEQYSLRHSDILPRRQSVVDPHLCLLLPPCRSMGECLSDISLSLSLSLPPLNTLVCGNNQRGRWWYCPVLGRKLYSLSAPRGRAQGPRSLFGGISISIFDMGVFLPGEKKRNLKRETKERARLDGTKESRKTGMRRKRVITFFPSRRQNFILNLPRVKRSSRNWCCNKRSLSTHSVMAM